MRNKIVLFLTVLSAFLFVSFGIFHEGKAEIRQQAAYVLPGSLQEIEEEAFSGTTAEMVILPEGFLRIGEKAFAGAWHLKDVFIPDTTEYIADSAFIITSDLTIHGIEGSYAEDWAKKNKVCFADDNILTIILQNRKTQNTQTDQIHKGFFEFLFILFILFGSSWLGCFVTRSRRPQDRPELNPIDYRFP